MPDEAINIPKRRSELTYEELIDCGYGRLFGDGNAQLPLPPMLMFDRITHIECKNEKNDSGIVTAELDVTPDLWFFQCHFHQDSVMPGCLGLDAMWQLVGFYLGWRGYSGRGRALGVSNVKFFGEVSTENKLVSYQVSVRRVLNQRLVLGIADGEVKVDDEPIYSCTNLRVGLIK